MKAARVAGLILVILGFVVLMWGGVFWKERETVLDAGPVQIGTEQQKGISLPPVLGGVAIAVGAILLLVPRRNAV